MKKQITGEPRFELVPIDTIELPEYNPREISDDDFSKLRSDIKKDPAFLKQRPPLLNHITKGNRLVCYAGFQRTRAAKENGETHIHCWIEDNVPKKVQDDRMLKDNLHRGEWDYEKLRSFDTDFLIDVGFSLRDLEINLNDSNAKAEAKNKLQEDFIIPPFSVFDSRQGYWQDRKRLWFDIGIRSHESREDLETTGTLSGSVPKYYETKNKIEKLLSRELSNEEFEAKYLAEFMNENSTIKNTKSGGILSVFDPVVCEIVYRWFVPEHGKILDPFAGGSVRGIVAGYLGYGYTGIDLRKEQVECNIRQGNELNIKNVSWLQGDSNYLEKIIAKDESFDFVFSCPPYFDLEKYSDDAADLSNLEWDEFRKQYADIIKKSISRLSNNRFACFVVGDIRNDSGYYRNFVSETINNFIDAGALLYNEIILLNQIGSLPIRVGRQFQNSRKTGKAHQNILVFYKGDPLKIKDEFPVIKNLEKALQEKNYERNIAPSVTA